MVSDRAGFLASRIAGVLAAVLALSGCTWQWEQYRPGAMGGNGSACRTTGDACDTGLACNAAPQLATARCRPAVATNATCDPAGATNACTQPGLCVTVAGASRCSGGYAESTANTAIFIDACGAGGTHLRIAGGVDYRDDGHSESALVLPFPFLYFGVLQAQLWPSTNGYAVFDSTPPPDDDLQGTGSIPASRSLIAPFKSDQALRDAPGSDICTITSGTAPNRRFVIEWLDTESIYATEDPTATHVTFELILNETGNVIEFVYSRLQFTGTGTGAMFVDGSEAAIGLQGPGPTNVVLHRGAVNTASSIRWTPL